MSAELKPLAVDARGAGRLVGMSERSWRRRVAAGEAPRGVRIGGRLVRWPTDELRAWLLAGAPNQEQWERSRGAGLDGAHTGR